MRLVARDFLESRQEGLVYELGPEFVNLQETGRVRVSEQQEAGQYGERSRCRTHKLVVIDCLDGPIRIDL